MDTGRNNELHTHSVTLDKSKCIGCTDCIKRCPTEAIRVRNKTAVIIDEKCIDCGMCIRVCKNRAKKAKADKLEIINKYKVKIAIPAPTLYTQFKDIHNINMILTGLKDIGFDEVIEVAKGAEIISKHTKEYMRDTSIQKPIISSACPAVVKIIQNRFPFLIPNILQFISPKEITARMTKKMYLMKGYKEEDIGIFFISPCAAKITNSKYPQVIEKSSVNGIIAIKDIYKPLLKAMKKRKHYEVLRLSTEKGMRWACPGGEVSGADMQNYVSVDGIQNVIKILELIEDNKLENTDFVECLACTGGCLGGPLTVENPFVAKCRMDKVSRVEEEKRELPLDADGIDYNWSKKLMPHEVLKLDEDFQGALEKVEKIELIFNQLPKIDCGSCGAPTCYALAEDIVTNEANIEDCIFMLKTEVKKLAEQMAALANKIPGNQ